MKTKGILGMALALALSSAMAVTAFAAEASNGGSYLTGQKKNSERHALYEQATTITTDADRSAFFAEKGIGGAYSNAQHLDADALVAAGIIDQATADSIRQYAADKHTRISGRYAGMGDMTPTERHAYYAGFDRSGGDSVDALLDAGIITQEQADAINAWLAE